MSEFYFHFNPFLTLGVCAKMVYCGTFLFYSFTIYVFMYIFLQHIAICSVSTSFLYIYALHCNIVASLRIVGLSVCLFVSRVRLALQMQRYAGYL